MTPDGGSMLYTRCPGCQTVFRVSAAQLALREGQVRCGHCRAVFDANRERVALDAPRDEEVHAPTEASATETAVIEADAAEAAATEADATEAAATETAATEADATETDATEADATETDATEADATEAAAAESTEAPVRIEEIPSRPGRFECKPRKPLRERRTALYGAAIAVLLAALAAQALFEYRDALAARAPFTRPLLEAACGAFGCAIAPLRDAAALSIDASDLRADPAHRGLLKLSATIRNRASYPIAWPYLELTLTDASDSVVARRAFTPAEYARTASDVPHGIPANGEEVVALSLDASETSQSGYRLYLFYP